jgi:hypothetical protein
MPLLILILPLLVLGWGCGTATQTAAPVPTQEATEEPTSQPKDLRARHGTMFKELRALVKELEASGRYDCCIQEPCSHCAMMVGGCSCGEGLRRGEPVCEECALMWIRGLGAESGVDPKTVRSFLEAERIINAKAAKSHSEHQKKTKAKAKHQKGHHH